MKTKYITCLFLVLTVLLLPINFAKAIDLLQRYPTELTNGDANPEHARPWEFTAEDIFRLSQFSFKVGEKLKIKTGVADLAIGHCADGAVWAVVIPREQGTLTSSVADKGEAIANIWLRFHPAQIDHLFPPNMVFADGNTNLTKKIFAIAMRKMTSSWQSDGKAMIPPPQNLSVYVDTKDDSHRFFMVDMAKQTAEYVGAFNRQSHSSVSPDSIPPVVIKTVPEAGSTNVPPREFEIKISFSKEMTDQSWSWSTAWKDSTPESIGKPHYEPDHKTCMLKVKLEPGKSYGWWLNSQEFHGFQDSQHHPALPYLLTFKTNGQEP